MVNTLRRCHRWMGSVGAVLLVVLAATGAFMQAQWLWQAYQPPPPIAPQRAFPSAELPQLEPILKPP